MSNIFRVSCSAIVFLGCVALARAEESKTGYFGLQPVKIPGSPNLGISSVDEGSPAKAAGVQPGDILLAMNGEMPGSRLAGRDWSAWWSQFHAGDLVELRLERGGNEINVLLRLSERPADVEEEHRAFVAAEEECAAEEVAEAAKPLEPDTWIVPGEWQAVLNQVRQHGGAAVLRLVSGEKGVQILLDVPEGAPAGLTTTHLPPWVAAAAQKLSQGEGKSYRLVAGKGRGFTMQKLD